MGHYKSNVRDLEFNLFEVLGLGSLLDGDAYGDLDTETVKEMLNEVRRLAEGPLADSFVDGDRNPPTFDPATHTVTLPESFKKSYRALEDAGWAKVGVREELGGLAAPSAVTWALSEMVLGANPRPRCTPRVRASRRSSTTTAPMSRRSGLRSSPIATGAPPWC